MAKPSISMPDVMLETVDERVGPDRSEWIRGAILFRIFAEDADDRDELPEPWQNAISEYLEVTDPASIEAKTT